MRQRRSIRSLVARAAFRLRGSAAAGFLVRQAFARAHRALPIRRVAEGPHVVAFDHPVAAFAPLHVLLVPKFAARSVMHLAGVQREQIAGEVEMLGRDVLDRRGLVESGFLVVVNGGRRQDVAQVHFHLLTAGYELAPAPAGLKPGEWIDVPDRSCGVHQVRAGAEPLLSGLVHAAEMHDALQLERRGYSIVWDARASDGDGVVHLTAGEPSER